MRKTNTEVAEMIDRLGLRPEFVTTEGGHQIVLMERPVYEAMLQAAGAARTDPVAGASGGQDVGK